LKNSDLGNGRRVCGLRFRSPAAPGEVGKVEVRHGFTEMGQGVHTVALQTAVTELGIDPARIEVHVDTTRELGFGQTTGSRGTLMVAGSVQKACQVALAAGCAPDDPAGMSSTGPKLGDPAVPTHDPAHLVCAGGGGRQGDGGDREGDRDPRRGQGDQPAAVRGPDRRFGAHGPGLCAHRGVPQRRAWIPHGDDAAPLGHPAPETIPAIEVELVEVPMRSTYSVGRRQIGLVPTSGAVAAALHMADGVWRTTLPMRRGDAAD
jgi:xanthine dehydrogenase molybdenum-binding subunit